MSSHAATGVFYIVGGQHRYEAARKYREQQIEAHRPVPDWCQKFKCTILRSGLTRGVVEVIAGRLQAQASTLKNMTVAESLEFFYRSYKEAQGSRTVTDLLRDTFRKTGKTVKDGTPVCNAFKAAVCI